MRGGTYQKGFIGEHKIATIKARAKATGQAKFIAGSVKLLAGDGKGSDVEAETAAVAETTIVPVGELPAAAFKGTGAVVVVTDIDGDGVISLVRHQGRWQRPGLGGQLRRRVGHGYR